MTTDFITVEERTARALERIATALEQGVLERIDNNHIIDHPANATAADPYPEFLLPGDEIADLPPVIPVTQPVLQDVCPIHKTPWKTVPAGISKRTGRSYAAFRACSTPGCDQRPKL